MLSSTLSFGNTLVRWEVRAMEADVTVITERRGRFVLRDNERNGAVAERLLQPAFCLRAGVRHDAVAPILPQAIAA